MSLKPSVSEQAERAARSCIYCGCDPGPAGDPDWWMVDTADDNPGMVCRRDGCRQQAVADGCTTVLLDLPPGEVR